MYPKAVTALEDSWVLLFCLFFWQLLVSALKSPQVQFRCLTSKWTSLGKSPPALDPLPGNSLQISDRAHKGDLSSWQMYIWAEWSQPHLLEEHQRNCQEKAKLCWNIFCDALGLSFEHDTLKLSAHSSPAWTHWGNLGGKSVLLPDSNCLQPGLKAWDLNSKSEPVWSISQNNWFIPLKHCAKLSPTTFFSGSWEPCFSGCSWPWQLENRLHRGKSIEESPLPVKGRGGKYTDDTEEWGAIHGQAQIQFWGRDRDSLG